MRAGSCLILLRYPEWIDVRGAFIVFKAILAMESGEDTQLGVHFEWAHYNVQ